MSAGDLYVHELPADLHDYLKDNTGPGKANSKRAALIALLREARRQGLAVGLTVREDRSTR